MTRADSLHLGHDPDALAVRAGPTDLSYGELEAAIGDAARRLADLGVRPGDRVAIWAPKRAETVTAILGTLRAGAIAVPVNPVLKAAQLEHILGDSGAVLLVADAPRLAAIETDVPVADLTLFDTATSIAGSALEADPPDNLAMILYTSGSTGKPKGVVLSHDNLCTGAASVAEYLGTGADDRILVPLPLSFDYGLNQLLTGLRQGAAVVLIDYLLPRDVVRAVSKNAITQLPGVPPLWMQLDGLAWPEEARESLRLITNTGGHMPERLTRSFSELFPKARIFLMYGLTEAFRSAYLDPALALEKPNSVGTAIPNAELFVVDADGEECLPGEVGELVHCGPLVAQGYWQDAERTAQRFRPAPAYSRYGGMAVWSGDRFSRGEDGLLYFAARADDMIKSAGHRVSPTEIEEAAQATGLVAEAAAFGVPDPDRGQAIILFAVPTAGGDENGDGVLAEMKKLAPNYMLPRDIVWRSELPRTPNGKIDRQVLKQDLVEGRAAA